MTYCDPDSAIVPRQYPLPVPSCPSPLLNCYNHPNMSHFGLPPFPVPLVTKVRGAEFCSDDIRRLSYIPSVTHLSAQVRNDERIGSRSFARMLSTSLPKITQLDLHFNWPPYCRDHTGFMQHFIQVILETKVAGSIRSVPYLGNATSFPGNVLRLYQDSCYEESAHATNYVLDNS